MHPAFKNARADPDRLTCSNNSTVSPVSVLPPTRTINRAKTRLCPSIAAVAQKLPPNLARPALAAEPVPNMIKRSSHFDFCYLLIVQPLNRFAQQPRRDLLCPLAHCHCSQPSWQQSSWQRRGLPFSLENKTLQANREPSSPVRWARPTHRQKFHLWSERTAMPRPHPSRLLACVGHQPRSNHLPARMLLFSSTLRQASPGKFGIARRKRWPDCLRRPATPIAFS